MNIINSICNIINSICEILYEIVYNIIYTIPTIIFYAIISYLAVKFIFSRIHSTQRLKILIFYLFGIFSNKLSLIKLVNKIHKDNKYVDIDIQFWTNLLNNNTNQTRSNSFGTIFSKKSKI